MARASVPEVNDPSCACVVLASPPTPRRAFNLTTALEIPLSFILVKLYNVYKRPHHPDTVAV